MNIISNAEIVRQIDAAIRWIHLKAVQVDDLAAALPEAVEGPGYLWCGLPYAIVADHHGYLVIRADGAERGAVITLEEATKVVGNVQFAAWAVEIGLICYMLDGYVSHARIIEAFRAAKKDRKKSAGGIVAVLNELRADYDADDYIDGIMAAFDRKASTATAAVAA